MHVHVVSVLLHKRPKFTVDSRMLTLCRQLSHEKCTYVCCLNCRFCMVFSEVPFMSELNPEYLKVVKCLEISHANFSLKYYDR